MLELSRKKDYVTCEEVFKQDEPHFLLNLGIQIVKTEDIVGLSLPLDQIIRDNKMERLMKMVEKEGWNDPHPQTINLVRAAKGKYAGKYTVSEGGNHRPVLAYELGIEEIEALVDIEIPKRLVSPEAMDKIDGIKHKISQMESEANQLNNFLRSVGIKRFYEYQKEDRKLERMFELIDTEYRKIDKILKDEAIALGYIPWDKDASPRVQIKTKNSE